MIRSGISVLAAAAALSLACGGASIGGGAGFSGGGGGSASASASVSASATIKVPLAQMPTKYASWVVEAEGYLLAVDEAYEDYMQAKAELAAALGVEANADAIAGFIRDAIKVETQLVCQPPSFNAGFAANCQAEAGARAAGSAGDGRASGEAQAGIQANCQARATLSLRPGSCKLETTVSEHPLLSNPEKWARAEANMKIMLQLHAANRFLDGRGAGINSRGLKLHVEAVTDLAKDPTLALQLNKIQAELKKGAEAASLANDKQNTMNSELGRISGAIDAQFPDLRAAVNAGV